MWFMMSFNEGSGIKCKMDKCKSFGMSYRNIKRFWTQITTDYKEFVDEILEGEVFPILKVVQQDI